MIRISPTSLTSQRSEGLCKESSMPFFKWRVTYYTCKFYEKVNKKIRLYCKLKLNKVKFRYVVQSTATQRSVFQTHSSVSRRQRTWLVNHLQESLFDRLYVPIITQDPLERFASNFDWGTHEDPYGFLCRFKNSKFSKFTFLGKVKFPVKAGFPSLFIIKIIILKVLL